MNLKRQGLSLALVSIMSLGAAQAADAALILAYGQSVAGATVNAVANGAQTQTTITGVNVPIGITFIENGAPTGAFLNFTFTSTNAATANGGNFDQNFSGTF